jgi:hypothetical protein
MMATGIVIVGVQYDLNPVEVRRCLANASEEAIYEEWAPTRG